MSVPSRRAPTTVAIALTALAFAPVAVSAQSQLAAAEATAFLGTWVVTINSEFGLFTLDLEIEDQAGKVAVEIGSPEYGGMQEVTDVTRDEESLVLEYDAEAEGQYFSVTVVLERDGDDLFVGIEAADGQFYAEGTGKRSDG